MSPHSPLRLPAHPVLLTDVTASAALLRGIPAVPVMGGMADGLVRADVGLAAGRVCSAADLAGAPRVSARGWTMLPRLVDGHVHLDKTYTIAETGLGDGSLHGAMGAVYARKPDWTQAHYLARMRRAAEAALHSGTGVMRTHIDCMMLPSETLAWQAAQEVQGAYAGRLTLQLCALSALSRAAEPQFAQRCRDVAAASGVIGAFIPPGGADAELLDRFLTVADAHGLDVDFHVDEHLGPGPSGAPGPSDTEALAQAVLRTGYGGRVVAGHACALATLPKDRLAEALDTIAEAGLTIAALPRTNLFLQDRAEGETPRARGITVVHEMAARGIPVMLASDNVNDAFYPFGEYDMLGLLRDAAVALHLDRALGRWVGSVADIPARALGLDGSGVIGPGVIGPGAQADMVLVPATDWSGILSTPPADRMIVINGAPQAEQAPADRESVVQ